MSEKPPLGLMPERIWKLHRLGDVKEAMLRYIDANIQVPVEWSNEYRELIKEVYHGNESE